MNKLIRENVPDFERARFCWLHILSDFTLTARNQYYQFQIFMKGVIHIVNSQMHWMPRCLC